MALSLATKEVIVMARFLQSFNGNLVTFPITVYEDSQPSTKIAMNTAGAASRTRHIDIRYHYIRQEILAGKINLQWVHTTQQAADGLTKALGKTSFRRFRGLVCLVDCSNLTS